MSNLVDGRYQLLDVIGAGGMATVWRAQDLRLNRLVALKRPRPAVGELSTLDPEAADSDPLDSSSLQARMSREMQLAASLSHPNLVTVHDAGHDASGLYLVMELVEAPSLAEVLGHAGQLERSKALTVGAQIGDALAAVHRVGIVHRDVKPGNILLADSGAKLTDFGIATGASADATAQTSLTMAGSVLATANYASPEVLAGQPPTDRSDVYSLAAVVYQMLTGRLPFPDTGRLDPVPTCGDAALDGLFAEALARDGWRRPDAATVAARLRDASDAAGSQSGVPGVNPKDNTAVTSAVVAPITPPGGGADQTAAMPWPIESGVAASTGTPSPSLGSEAPRPAVEVVGRPLLPEPEPRAPQASWPQGSGGQGGSGRRTGHGGQDGRGARPGSTSGLGGRIGALAIVAAVLLAGWLGLRSLRSDDSVEATGDSVESASDDDENRIDAGEGDDITPQTLPSTTTTEAAPADGAESEVEGNESEVDGETGSDDPLTRTLDDLEEALDRADEQFEDSGLPSDDVENLLDRAREAINSARDSEELETVQRLDELRRELDEATGDESEGSARDRLERLARLLGFDSDEESEDD